MSDLEAMLLASTPESRAQKMRRLTRRWMRKSTNFIENEFTVIMGVLGISLIPLLGRLFFGHGWLFAGLWLTLETALGLVLYLKRRTPTAVKPGRPAATRTTLQFTLPVVDWRDLILPGTTLIIVSGVMIYLKYRFGISLWLLVVSPLAAAATLWRADIAAFLALRKSRGDRAIFWPVSIILLPFLIITLQAVSLSQEDRFVGLAYLILAIMAGIGWVLLIHIMWPTHLHIDALVRRLKAGRKTVIMANIMLALVFVFIMFLIFIAFRPASLIAITVWLMILTVGIYFFAGNRPHPIQGKPEGEFVLALPVAKRVAIFALIRFAMCEMLLAGAAISTWWFLPFPAPLVCGLIGLVAMWIIYQWFRNHSLTLNIMWQTIKVEMNGINELFIEDRYLGEGRREGYDLPKLGNCEMGDPKGAFDSIIAWLYGYGILRFGVIGDKARGELYILTRGARYPVVEPGGKIVWVYDGEAVLRWALAAIDEANRRIRQKGK